MPTHEQVSSEVWADLVIAILCVNNYRLDQLFQRYEQLRRAGLFDPNNLRDFAPEVIVHCLISAGYDRGPWLTKLMGDRLKALGFWVSKQDRLAIERVLTRESKEVVTHLLEGVKGVGPMVIETFINLRA